MLYEIKIVHFLSCQSFTGQQYVLYKSDGLAAVVHIKEYGVALILGDVHAIGQDAVPVAVERVVCQSYSVAHVCAIMIFSVQK